MKKVYQYQSNIETTFGGGGSGSAPDPDVEMGSTGTDNPSDRTVVMAGKDYRAPSCFIGVTNEQAEREEEEEEAMKISPIQDIEDIAKSESESRSSSLSKSLTESESRSFPSSPEAEGPTSSVGAVDPSANANANTNANTDTDVPVPITLAPRGSVFRYFGADYGSFDLPPTRPNHSTKVHMFDSNASAYRNPSTVDSKPNSDYPPHFLSDFLDLDSITSNSEVTPPPLLKTEVLLHPPTLKARRGTVFAYFGDLDDDMLNPPVLSLSEESFHTPIPRS